MSEAGSRPGKMITRSVSEHVKCDRAADRTMLLPYAGATAAVLALLVNVRPILAAFTAVVDLAR